MLSFKLKKQRILLLFHLFTLLSISISLFANPDREMVLKYADTVKDRNTLVERGVFSYEFEYRYYVENGSGDQKVVIKKEGKFIYSDERIRNEMIYSQEGSHKSINNRKVIAVLNYDYFAFNDNGEDIKKYELGPKRERNETTTYMVLAHLTDLNHYLDGFGYNPDTPIRFTDWIMSWNDLVASYRFIKTGDSVRIEADTKYGNLYKLEFSEEYNKSLMSLEMFDSIGPDGSKQIIVNRTYEYDLEKSELYKNFPIMIKSESYSDPGLPTSTIEILLFNYKFNKEYDHSLFEFDSIDDDVKPNVPMIEVSYENIPRILDKNASGKWQVLNEAVAANRQPNKTKQTQPELPRSNINYLLVGGIALTLLALIFRLLNKTSRK